MIVLRPHVEYTLNSSLLCVGVRRGSPLRAHHDRRGVCNASDGVVRPQGPGATLLPEARHYFNRSGLRSSEGSRNVERCARVSGLVGK